ncbi:MAG: ferrous iron transport protein B [Candidatus Heimdallarchaeota archaeon]|nr:ferrous iron transport protein B [Candidatus Heimdallarchaeota archaeon]
MGNNETRIILAGNPNVGKSLVFNELTGSHQKIANFPGITVTRTAGFYNYQNQRYDVIDLPGLYGFNSGNIEEAIAHEYIIKHDHDLIINVVDGRKLERNMYLTLQLRELKLPMIMVVTFRDKLEKNRLKIDIPLLSKKLGIPVLLISAFDENDIHRLREIIFETIDSGSREFPQTYLGEYEKLIQGIAELVSTTVLLQPDEVLNRVPIRWVALSIMMSKQEKHNLWPLWLVDKVRSELSQHDEDIESLSVALISKYYDEISNIIEETVDDSEYLRNEGKWSQRMDHLFLHPVIGFIIFIGIMMMVFKLTYEVSTPISEILSDSAGQLADFTRESISNELFASFLADALIGGVGFILVFIPQIAILFFFLAVLEHSGYLARVVFITDRYLNKIGISGTSIAPLLLGFGCNVPAIMASKTVKDENERKAMVLVNPFMSCSARLPVYIIITGALFPDHAGYIIGALYLSGVVVAILVLFILRKTVLKGQTSTLLMELPDLSRPPVKLTLSRMYRQTKNFAENAASWMAIGLIIIWVLSITGPTGYIGPAALTDTDLLHDTWIFAIGDVLHPLFAWFGWDSRLLVALVFGFIAKEVVISSFGLIYGVKTASFSTVILSQFNPASGLAYLFFVLFYTPCIGSLMAIKQEVGTKYMVFSIALGMSVAYLTASLALFVGRLIF